MSFQPIIPLSGLGGWRFLQRTMAQQQETFNNGPQITRDVAYFRDKIAEATTAEALVSDPQLLRVAMGAFGLADEVPKKALIRRVLEQGSENPDALARKLGNARWRDLAEAFGYGDEGGARVATEGFAADIAARYRVAQFEVAVGAVDETMRFALTFERDGASLAAQTGSERAKWFGVLGTPPLRKVIETALGLPSQFAQLDIDRQAEEIADRFSRAFDASINDLGDPAVRERVLRRFFVMDQIDKGPSSLTPGASALTLLQPLSLGPIGAANLLQSRF